MLAVSRVAQEAAFWVFLVAAILGLIGGLLRLASKANRIIDTTEETAHLVRWHLGPNGDSPKMFETVNRTDERVKDLERRLDAFEADHGS